MKTLSGILTLVALCLALVSPVAFAADKPADGHASDAAAGHGDAAGHHGGADAFHEPGGFHNFMEIVTKPDNIPIVAMLFLVIYFFWLSMRMGLENDRLTAKGEKDKVYERMNRWVWGESDGEGGS